MTMRIRILHSSSSVRRSQLSSTASIMKAKVPKQMLSISSMGTKFQRVRNAPAKNNAGAPKRPLLMGSTSTEKKASRFCNKNTQKKWTKVLHLKKNSKQEIHKSVFLKAKLLRSAPLKFKVNQESALKNKKAVILIYIALVRENQMSWRWRTVKNLLYLI